MAHRTAFPSIAVRRYALLTALVLGPASGSTAGQQSEPAVKPTPLLMDVLSPPRLLPGADNADHIVYELRLANPTGSRVALRELRVVDPADGRRLATLERDAITQRFHLGARRDRNVAALDVAQYGILFLHVEIPEEEPLPRALGHEVVVDIPGTGEGLVVSDQPVAIAPFSPPVLGAPLRGDKYVAADGCCDSVRHIRALLPLDGRLRLAQRFAIDWEQTTNDGRLVVGDLSDPESYVIYGNEVLAVAGGEVVAAADGLPDQEPGALPENLPIAEANGNHVILEIGDGLYALYAHLKPGSVAVTPGERVAKGDVIGRVGNSGNTLAPHLHLHVMDNPSRLDADGLPYVFERFRATAIDKAGTTDFDQAEASGEPLTLTPVDPPEVHTRHLPMDLWSSTG